MADGRLGDYPNPLHQRILPATSMPMPPGPARFPTETKLVQTPAEILASILRELKNQMMPTKGIFQAVAVNGLRPQTLDWSAFGMMTRLVIRNAGPQSVWFQFDIEGGNVDNFTSNQSWMLQSQESFNVTNELFMKIGLRCAAGGANNALVHARAWGTPAGKQEGSAI